MQITPTKLGKNETRCYACKLTFAKRVGSWFDWNHMQVFLCAACEKATQDKPERTGRMS